MAMSSMISFMGRMWNFLSLYIPQKVHLLWVHPTVHWSR